MLVCVCCSPALLQCLLWGRYSCAGMLKWKWLWKKLCHMSFEYCWWGYKHNITALENYGNLLESVSDFAFEGYAGNVAGHLFGSYVTSSVPYLCVCLATMQLIYIFVCCIHISHSGHAVWGVGLGRLVAGIVGSNPAQGMDVCPRLSVPCNGLITRPRSPTICFIS
jgi:hypothetical protein